MDILLKKVLKQVFKKYSRNKITQKSPQKCKFTQKRTQQINVAQKSEFNQRRIFFSFFFKNMFGEGVHYKIFLLVIIYIFYKMKYLLQHRCRTTRSCRHKALLSRSGPDSIKKDSICLQGQS